MQPDWVAAAPCEAMQHRERIIRREAASWVRQFADDLAAHLLCASEELVVEGKDSTGYYSRVPWVRFADRRYSPNPRTGWYVVYLFAEDGAEAFLSLNQGTQRWDGVGMRSQPADQIRQRSDWARTALEDDLLLRPRLIGRSGWGRETRVGPTRPGMWWPLPTRVVRCLMTMSFLRT